MKVCIVAPVHKYNDVRVFKKEAISLANNGFNVVLYVNTNNVKSLDNITIKPYKYRSRISRILKIPLLFYRILGENADVYHLHNPDTLPIAFTLKLLKKKVIYDTHEDFRGKILIKDWIPQNLRRPLANIVFNMEVRVSKLVDQVIVTQEEQLDIFNNSTLIENTPIIDKQIIKRVYEKSKEVKSDKDILRFIYIGSISKERGLHIMMNLLGYINQVKKARLWLIGRYDKSIEEARCMETWQYVDYLGELDQEDAFAYLVKSDFGLLTVEDVADFKFTSPNKIFEYMLFGKPVIANNFDNWMKKMGYLENGIFVDVSNIENEVSNILNFLENKKNYYKSSIIGRQYIYKHYNWSNEENKLLAIYNNI